RYADDAASLCRQVCNGDLVPLLTTLLRSLVCCRETSLRYPDRGAGLTPPEWAGQIQVTALVRESAVIAPFFRISYRAETCRGHPGPGSQCDCHQNNHGTIPLEDVWHIDSGA